MTFPLIDFFNAKIKIFVLINGFWQNIFAPSIHYL
jgi:hypothetical protein